MKLYKVHPFFILLEDEGCEPDLKGRICE